MWVRMRLDIGWLDLLNGLANCFKPTKRSTAVEQAAQTWSRQENFLITLSVRSAFDLTLRALQLPRGSEILLSALTVPDMVRIVRLHGLIPVPVDTDDNGNLRVESLRQALTSKTRMIVVAHLFGGQAKLDNVLEVAQERDILVVEDCAQSFRRVGDSGHPGSDIAMFSFGPIKTASAVGGGVLRVSSTMLRKRIAEILKNDPIQSNLSFARRIIRFSAIKLLSTKRGASLFRSYARFLGHDFDQLANSVARGFAASDLMPQIRRQPSTALLRLLRRRWRTYDFARVQRRIAMGRHLDDRIGVHHDMTHAYWVYPLFVSFPLAVRDRLRNAGFDASCESRMCVVPEIDDSNRAASTRLRWKHVVFLPWYPDLPDDAVNQMADLISRSEFLTDCEPKRPNIAMQEEQPTIRVLEQGLS